jgi:hypothetical protein
MTNDTKAEIVLVAVAAVAVLWLWHNNTQATGDSGLGAFPSFSLNNPQAAPGAVNFDIPAPTAGYDPTINLPAWNLPSFTLPMAAGSPSSCDCSQQTDQAFGSNSDLSSWLNSTLDPATMAAQASDWY